MNNNYQNMNLVLDDSYGKIWLGDIRAAFEKKGLYDKNIKTVMTAASGITVSYPTNKITHHVYFMQDRENFDISRFFDKTGKDLDEALRRGPVYVHCHAGISRSASVIIAYLIKYRNMTFNQGFNLLRSKRPVVFPNYGFQKQLKAYELENRLKNLSSDIKSKSQIEKEQFESQMAPQKMNQTFFSDFSKQLESIQEKNYLQPQMNTTVSKTFYTSKSKNQPKQQSKAKIENPLIKDIANNITKPIQGPNIIKYDSRNNRAIENKNDQTKPPIRSESYNNYRTFQPNQKFMNHKTTYGYSYNNQ